MLEHLRVLDLTDERGLLCGRLLGDLGADVVQVEPLDGSSARSAPPVTGDDVYSSLYWETFAASKRGIALALDQEEGLGIVRRLAAAADVLVTSMPREWLRVRGLHPDQLLPTHRDLVYVVISPFGWSGPKAGYADSDLVVWAAGGPLEPHRDGDRPPLRISVPQAFLHASADAAAGALLAVLARPRVGGQLVEVSAQASLGAATLSRVLAAAVGDSNPEWQQQPVARTDQSGSGAATPNSLKKWYCRDGMVELHLSMGAAAGGFTNNLFAWLADERAVPDDIAAWDWRTVPDRLLSGELSASDIDRARGAVREFLLTKTKADVVEAALERRLLCMAIYDMADVLASPHLAERGYWAEVTVAERPTRIPGVLAHATGPSGPGVRRRAPRLGEHTDDVLAGWLGETTVSSRPAVTGART
jgi:crotonobetainyl-CoA:carnitine CoA-transferase CaiB-like acyl-CoA transferase